jgi:hypothetical protein
MAGPCDLDQWKFYQGQCTSWVSYRLNQLNGVGFSDYYGGQHWGDASGWATAARNLGIAVNTTPAAGSIAWYSQDHVAYVEQVNSPTSVVISEMNYDYANGFRVRTVTAGSSGWPTDFIHLADRSDAVPDGSFASYQGNVYRIAGGAPVYISSWNNVGGPQSATALTDAQWASLRQYPADGTLVSTAAGYVYRFAGGAPLYVSNWNAIGGSQPTTQVSQSVLGNGDRSVPWNHVHRYPANKTFLKTGTGDVYEVAGGAPFAVSNWSTVGGQQPYTLIDAWDISHRTNAAAHLRPTPAARTGVTGLPSKTPWRFTAACRTKTTPSASATAVPDSGISKYTACPAITTSTLPSGTIGKAYSATLTHSGGTGTATWTTTAGKLPAGLALAKNGKITGKPTKAGTYPFSVEVTDSAKSAATRKLAITVKK